MTEPDSPTSEIHQEQTPSASPKPPNLLNRYWTQSKNPLFSFVIAVPLLLIYEALIYMTQPDAEHAVRISADVWMKSLYVYLGYNTLSITLLIVALFGIFIFINQRRKGTRLNGRYLLMMLVESTIWAVLLAWLISGLTGYLLDIQATTGANGNSFSILQEFAFSLGAGLYEELFFRLILVWVGFQLFKRVFDPKWLAYTAAALISAFLFSLAHFTGSLGDPFTIQAFLFRFLFGLALNALFVTRGFGITAWTHAIYDLLVIFILS
jgi:membrane protease YdiL (CAAX protease family)